MHYAKSSGSLYLTLGDVNPLRLPKKVAESCLPQKILAEKFLARTREARRLVEQHFADLQFRYGA